MPKRATPDAEGKRVALMSRTTIALRKVLETAAGESGRSLAQEVELRLEQSFRDDDLQSILLGGQRTARLFHYFSVVMRSAKTTDGKNWEDDPEIANVVGKAFYYLTLICSNSHSEANYILRKDPELERRVLYAAQLISNYVVLSYGADFNPEIMKDRDGAITPAEAIRRFIVDGEKV